MYANNHILIDVTVVCPTAPSYLQAASRRTLAAAARAERAKHNKYAELIRHQSATFLAFAVESTGAIGADAQLVYAHIASISEDSMCWAPKDIIEGLKDAVAVAIQRGNALIAAEGCTRTLSALARS